MHPGPINRGVEIAPEVADSAASRIVDQVRAGLVVRMAVLYDLLAGPGKADAEAALRIVSPDVVSAAGPGGGLMERLSCAPGRPGRPPDRRRPRRRPGIGARRRRARRPHPRGRDRRDRAEPRPHGARDDRRATASCSCPASSTRTSTCARPATRTRRTSRRAPARRRPAASPRSSRCRTRAPSSTRRSSWRAWSSRPGREACVPTGFMAAITAGQEGERMAEMCALAEAGAAAFSDDGRPVERAAILRRALPVRLGHGAAAGAPRGGPVAVGRRPHARGRGVGRARPARATRRSPRASWSAATWRSPATRARRCTSATSRRRSRWPRSGARASLESTSPPR